MPLPVTRFLLGFKMEERQKEAMKVYLMYFIATFPQMNVNINVKISFQVHGDCSLCAWHETNQIIHMSENHDCDCFCLFFFLGHKGQLPRSKQNLWLRVKSNAEKERGKEQGGVRWILTTCYGSDNRIKIIVLKKGFHDKEGCAHCQGRGMRPRYRSDV